MQLIIVAGMPATGKTTLAGALRNAFGYPVLEKDSIKEVLFDTLGFQDYPQKRKLDIAAAGVLLHVMETMLQAGRSVIAVNNFDTAGTQQLCGLIEKYQPKCVTVFLNGDARTLYRRYVERDNLHLRHLGHIVQEHYPPGPGDPVDHTMTWEEFDEKFIQRGMDKFSCPGGRIDLDMTDPAAVDPQEVIERIRALL